MATIDSTLDRPAPEPALRRRDRAAQAVLHAVLGVGLLIVVGPFLWIAISSVKPEGEIRDLPPTWWP
jgi:multiple sugar transport system permease protein